MSLQEYPRRARASDTFFNSLGSLTAAPFSFFGHKGVDGLRRVLGLSEGLLPQIPGHPPAVELVPELPLPAALGGVVADHQLGVLGVVEDAQLLQAAADGGLLLLPRAPAGQLALQLPAGHGLPRRQVQGPLPAAVLFRRGGELLGLLAGELPPGVQGEI